MTTKQRNRRPNPSRASNPSLLVSMLINGGVALTSIVVVSVAMQARRNRALMVCGRTGTLVES